MKKLRRRNRGQQGEYVTADIVPELLNKIETSFQSRMAKDATLRAIGKRIENGTALPADANNYAIRAGEALSGALQECLTAETLPDATLYYNIAMRTIEPTLRRNYELVNQAAAEIQSITDRANGIGLKPVKADFPMGRVKGLVDQICADDIELEAARKWLGEPIVNTTQSFHDDFVKENAKFRARAGMKVTIERRVSGGKPCEWCDVLAGEYAYGSEPGDVYRRHENCRCTVTYKNGRERQDVWTKEKWWNVGADQEQIAARRAAGLTKEDNFAKIETRKKAGLEDNVKRDFIRQIAEYPQLLGTYEPKQLKQELERMGYTVTPLSKGNFGGLPFEAGGGFKVNFSGDGVLMYHPEERSHHDGAYYKISTGVKGTVHYDIDGVRKVDKRQE